MSIDLVKAVYYEFLSYFVPQKQKYKITGKCNQCGKCCTQIRAWGMKNENDLKFMQKIFPWYNYFYISNIDSSGEIILSCKHLSELGKCKIYIFRPLLCRHYPKKYITHNIEMLDGCGYSVQKKNFKDYL